MLAGGLVLKPEADVEHTRWLADLASLDRLRWRSLLARAALFRLFAYAPSERAEEVGRELGRYERVVALLAE